MNVKYAVMLAMLTIFMRWLFGRPGVFLHWLTGRSMPDLAVDFVVIGTIVYDAPLPWRVAQLGPVTGVVDVVTSALWTYYAITWVIPTIRKLAVWYEQPESTIPAWLLPYATLAVIIGVMALLNILIAPSFWGSSQNHLVDVANMLDLPLCAVGVWCGTYGGGRRRGAVRRAVEHLAIQPHPRWAAAS